MKLNLVIKTNPITYQQEHLFWYCGETFIEIVFGVSSVQEYMQVNLSGK